MHRMALLALGLGILAGCASDVDERALAAFPANLDAYVGRPAHDLFNVIGMPTSEDTVAGLHAYVWDNSAIEQFPSFGAPATPPTAIEQHCTLRVVVDVADKVSRWDVDGGDGGCLPLARAFPPSG